MKPRLIAIVVAVGFVAFVVWWFMQPESSPLAKSPAAASSPKSHTSIAPLSQQSGQMPVVVTLNPPKPAPAESSAPVGEPRKELSTAVAEAIRILQARDYAGFMREFMPPSEIKGLPPQMPFDELVSAYARGIREEPDNARAIAAQIQALQTIQQQTPILNANGDQATYELNPPIDYLQSVIFIKENGLWYMEL